MLTETNPSTRKVVIAVVLIGALLMIALVPFMAFDMVNPITQGQIARIEKFTAEGNPQAPLLKLTPWLVSFFYPFWGTMSLIAGVALLVIVVPLYNGKPWARGLTLLCLAVPAMGGAYMIVPWMNFIGDGFPPAVIIMAIGLIPYFTVLLADKGDLTQKLVDFFVFLMLGVSSAESFANGHAAFRILYGHPQRPLFAEGIHITYVGWFMLWFGAALTIASIYLLGARRVSGWYTGVIGGLVTLVASGATHYVRHVTNDYLYGALFGLFIVVLLVIPMVKRRLLEEYSEEGDAKAVLQPVA
jgi:hypothetical protein